MDKTPQEIWEGLSEAQRKALITRDGHWLAGAQTRWALYARGCLRRVTMDLTPAGRAVAEHGRKAGER